MVRSIFRYLSKVFHSISYLTTFQYQHYPHFTTFLNSSKSIQSKNQIANTTMIQHSLIINTNDPNQYINQQKFKKNAQFLQVQQDFISNHKTYNELISINQSLKLSLQQLTQNLQNKLKPQHDRMKHQRTALNKVLSYQEDLSLKENFLYFLQLQQQNKSRLLNTVEKLERKNNRLFKNSINYSHQIEETKEVQEFMSQEKAQLSSCFGTLEEEKFMKQSIKNDIYQGQLCQIYQENSIQNQNSRSDFSQNGQDSISKNYLNIQINNNSFNSSHDSSTRRQERYKNALQVFDCLSLKERQPKSKQILNSLQKQLKPLKLKDIIALLEKQLEYLNNEKLQPLRKEKQNQLKIARKIKQKYEFNRQKLQKMKIHVKKFKQQRLGKKMQ